MPRELINANITHVSYVDKGANQKQFFFTKSDKQPDFQKEVKLFINKEDEEQQLVYGVVYEPNVEDSHGDFMTADSIEKAAHGFIKDARNIDTQ
ncbi:terminase, partial [Vitellibacter sp. q18]|nr:terminase [Aequorivita lutea]